MEEKRNGGLCIQLSYYLPNNYTKLFYIIIFDSYFTHNFFNMCIKLSKVCIILNNKLIIALKLSTHSYISVLLQNISWKCVDTFIKGFIESPLEKDVVYLQNFRSIA